jgi:hypothetical protein
MSLRELRDTVIRHCMARDIVAVRNTHDGEPCVMVGTIVKVGPAHIAVVHRDTTAVIPIANVVDVVLLEYAAPTASEGNRVRDFEP